VRATHSASPSALLHGPNLQSCLLYTTHQDCHQTVLCLSVYGPCAACPPCVVCKLNRVAGRSSLTGAEPKEPLSTIVDTPLAQSECTAQGSQPSPEVPFQGMLPEGADQGLGQWNRLERSVPDHASKEQGSPCLCSTRCQLFHGMELRISF
jgi:hypothetical protein